MEGIAGIIIAIILTGLIVPGISITKSRLNKDIDHYYKQNIETDKVIDGISNIEIENIAEVINQLKEIENSEDGEEITEETILNYLKESLEDFKLFDVGDENKEELKDEKTNKYFNDIKELEIFVSDKDDEEQILPLILYKGKIFNIIIKEEYIKINELVRGYALDRTVSEETGQVIYEKKDYTSTDDTDKHPDQVGIKNIRYIRR